MNSWRYRVLIGFSLASQTMHCKVLSQVLIEGMISAIGGIIPSPYHFTKSVPSNNYLGYLQEFINVFLPGSMSHCIYVLPSVYTVLPKGIKSYWLGLRYVRIVLQPLKLKFKADLPQVFTILFYFSFITFINIYVLPGLCSCFLTDQWVSVFLVIHK